MASRKRFVALAAASVGALIGVPALGQTPAAPAPPPSAQPTPDAFRVASALALQMRAFDPQLTDREIDAIAIGIGENLGIGAYINPNGRALKNWNEPAAHFEAQT